MKSWLVFDVGCIECRVPSAVVGLFYTKQEAERIAKELGGAPGKTAQHHFLVFDLSEFDRDE